MSEETLKAIREGKFSLDVSDKKPKIIGFIILFITFGIFGTWAVTAPLDSAAIAPGVVTVKTHRKTVQHLEGGIVSQILVRDGDKVFEGDPILVLDPTQFLAELEITRGQLMLTRAMEARLRAERDLLDTVTYPDDFDADDPRVYEAVQSENQVFTARMNSHEGEIQVLRQRISQLGEQIEGLQSIIRSKKELSLSYSEELSDLTELLSEGFVDRQRIRELERNVSQLRGEIAESESSIARLRMQQGETELQILQLQKEFHTNVVNQLSEVQGRVFDLREKSRALQDRVSRTVIKAPESGMVLDMQVHTIGGVVQGGTPILDIVPASVDLIVEAQVSPMDIDRVDTGTLADIRFSAFKAATTPVIEGRVTQISADRLTDPDTGMPYYRTRIEVTDEGMLMLGSLVLVPGMPAEVLIKTGERTLLQYLMQPATNAFARSFIED